MEEQNCEKCKLREKYDKAPKSFMGRLWRWHINFCPGWKSYMKTLDENKKSELISEYKLKSG